MRYDSTKPTTADIELSVSDFVALHNQILEYALPAVTIIGELANFRVSKNRWVYFDLKDETASVKFFGTVYQLSTPLEDGMLVRIHGAPRVHPQYGFSVNLLRVEPVGEGSIRRSADLLLQKLTAEGLFDPARKRGLPYPPSMVGIVTSKESAAYADFIKVLAARWGGLELVLADVQVQGEIAPSQIVKAIADLNQLPNPPDVLVIIRGGGSAEDLQAFNQEQVVRAVAGSRIPTLIAIGHETDVSLAELAADVHASTPSNAAELLVPDRRSEKLAVKEAGRTITQLLKGAVDHNRIRIAHSKQTLSYAAVAPLERATSRLAAHKAILELLNPKAVLGRGYAIVRDSSGNVLRSAAEAASHQRLAVEFLDATIMTTKEDN